MGYWQSGLEIEKKVCDFKVPLGYLGIIVKNFITEYDHKVSTIFIGELFSTSFPRFVVQSVPFGLAHYSQLGFNDCGTFDSRLMHLLKLRFKSSLLDLKCIRENN